MAMEKAPAGASREDLAVADWLVGRVVSHGRAVANLLEQEHIAEGALLVDSMLEAACLLQNVCAFTRVRLGVSGGPIDVVEHVGSPPMFSDTLRAWLLRLSRPSSGEVAKELRSQVVHGYALLCLCSVLFLVICGLASYDLRFTYGLKDMSYSACTVASLRCQVALLLWIDMDRVNHCLDLMRRAVPDVPGG